MEREARRRAAALDRYWDAVLRGDHGRLQTSDVGDDDAELVRALQALGTHPSLFPDPAQGWQDLLQHPELRDLPRGRPDGRGRTSNDHRESTLLITNPVRSGREAMEMNGRIDALPSRSASHGGSSGWQGWITTQLATAALLLLMLVGGLIVLGPWRPGPAGLPVSHLAVIDATPPAPALQTDGAPERLVTAWLPAGADLTNADVSFSRVPLAAGQGTQTASFIGPTIFAVRTGTLTVRADGPVGLARHDAPVPSDGTHPELAPGIEQPLQPGDAVIVPAGVPISLFNPGLGDAEGFAIGVLLDTKEGSKVSEPWPLLGKGVVQALTTPATVTVEQVLLAPGSAVDEHTGLGTAMVQVEAGSVMTGVGEGTAEASSGGFLRTGAVGPGITFLEAGQERRLREGAGLFIHPETTLTLRNEDDAPVRLLVLRLDPDTAGAGTAGSGTPAP